MSTTIKRALSLFLCAALLFGALPLTAVHAADPTSGTCGANLTWVYDSGAKTLTISGTGEMNNYDVDYYNDTYVTTAPWQPYDNTMQTLVINSGVTSIGWCAFSGCTGLTSVTIPDSVTSIGYGAFYGCTRLTSVTIPDSVTSIGDGAFEYCTGLTSVTIPDSVMSIGGDVFFGCTGLTSVTIPDSVTGIGDWAFYYCTGLTSVTIPDSVTSIGDYAFRYCTGLTSVTIPDSVTSIGSYAFYLVANVVYHGSASGSPWGARAVNGYVEGSLVYADSTKTTLLACPSSYQGEIAIPDSVTSIGYDAFFYCTGLTSVNIPNSVTSIGSYAFDLVPNVVYHGSASGSPWGARSVNGYVEGSLVYADSTKTTLLACPSSYQGEIAIPDSVTSIGYGAFALCEGLTSVTIGNSVTSIGEYAFYECGSLTDVYFQGTQAEWNEIKIDEYNESLLNATIHFNSTPPHVHSYTATVAKQPTCQEEGIKAFTCECGDTYTEPIAKLPHTPKTVTIPATCTATGAQYDICEACGETLSDVTTLPKLDHTYTETITKQPTCKEAGVKTFTCSGCGASYTEPVAKLAHTPKTVTIPATCQAAGAQYDICEVCGETLSDVTTLPKLDHTYTETITKQPTCKEAGVKTFTCSGCGASYTEPVARLAHTPGDWQTVKEPTETETGKAEKRCTVCGETLEEKELPKLEVVKDETTGIELSYSGEDYNGDVSVNVEQSFDGAAFNLVNTQTGAVQQAVYDITLSVNGAETQPNGKIKVKIPVPAGYDPAKTFVYHVNTATGKLEKMNAVYENGFMVFETDHFSFYAIVEAAPKVTKVELGDVTMNYKDSVTLKPTITADPGAKYTVKYSSSDPNKVKVDEKTGEVTGAKRGSATITCTVTDGSGNTVKDTCTVTVKYTVLQWLIIILLFGWIWY